MPGTERAPFFGHTTIFNEQPQISAFISTDQVQAVAPGGTVISFATPINVDPLNVQAWRSLWDPTVPGLFTITIRGLYVFGSCVHLEALIAARVQLQMYVGGTLIAAQETESNAQVKALSLSTMYPLQAGDTVATAIYHNAAGAINTFIFANLPNMWIARIG